MSNYKFHLRLNRLYSIAVGQKKVYLSLMPVTCLYYMWMYDANQSVFEKVQ